jgi:hypothetical protein
MRVAWAEAARAAAVREDDKAFRLERQDHVALKALLADGYTACIEPCAERAQVTPSTLVLGKVRTGSAILSALALTQVKQGASDLKAAPTL